MSLKRVKQIQRENDKKRCQGLAGPCISDDIMLSALRSAEKKLQEQPSAPKMHKPKHKRSLLALLAMLCLMALIPVGAWGYRRFVEPAPLSGISGHPHFSLQGDEFIARSNVSDDASLIYSVQFKDSIITLIEDHNQMGTQILFTDQDPAPSVSSVPFFGQTLQYYVDQDGVIGHVEFQSLHCLLRISMPNASESDFLYVVSHIQKLD